MQRAATADETVDPEKTILLPRARRWLPIAEGDHGDRFFVRIDGKLFATPLFIVLIAIGTTDLLFALDSIPAVFGVTDEAFIVFAANAFALLGLLIAVFFLARLTGDPTDLFLPIDATLEERAEGFLVVDPDAIATDTRFPDDDSHAKVAALLLLDRLARGPARIEELVEEAHALRLRESKLCQIEGCQQQAIRIEARIRSEYLRIRVEACPRAATVVGGAHLLQLAGRLPAHIALAIELAVARHLDIHVLMMVAVAGAMALGEWAEGASVVFLFALAQVLEAIASG